jgi:hypothetical protein
VLREGVRLAVVVLIHRLQPADLRALCAVVRTPRASESGFSRLEVKDIYISVY